MRLDFSNKSKDLPDNGTLNPREFILLHGHNNLRADILKAKREENDVRLELIEIAPGIQYLLRILVERRQVKLRNEPGFSAFYIEIGDQPIQDVRAQESDADCSSWVARKFLPLPIHIGDCRIRQIRLGQPGKPPRSFFGMAGLRGDFIQPSHRRDTGWIDGKRGPENLRSPLAISLLSQRLSQPDTNRGIAFQASLSSRNQGSDLYPAFGQGNRAFQKPARTTQASGSRFGIYGAPEDLRPRL